MNDLQLVCIPPDDVWRIWPGHVEALVDLGYAASDVPTPSDIVDQLKRGTMLLWLAVDADSHVAAAMLTQLFDMRHGRMCVMRECGGERLREWQHMRVEIEQYAKREGCDRVHVEGRPGWARVLSDYKTVSVVLEKRI